MIEELEQEDKKNKRIAWAGAVVVQMLLLAILYFFVAWQAPDPPLPEYGIELGFVSSAGAQASAPRASTQNESDSENEAAAEQVEEVSEENQTEEVPSEETVETVEKSDVPIEQEDETPASEETPTEVTNDQTADSTTEETSTEDSEQDGEEEEEKEVDERAIYGSQGKDSGNNEGASLSLSGWQWDFKPKPDDQSEESGKIVYQIIVDEEGEIIGLKPLTSTVSPSVERKYREAVEKLTFSKTSDYKPAPSSKGTITFIIKAR